MGPVTLNYNFWGVERHGVATYRVGDIRGDNVKVITLGLWFTTFVNLVAFGVGYVFVVSNGPGPGVDRYLCNWVGVETTFGPTHCFGGTIVFRGQGYGRWTACGLAEGVTPGHVFAYLRLALGHWEVAILFGVGALLLTGIFVGNG